MNCQCELEIRIRELRPQTFSRQRVAPKLCLAARRLQRGRFYAMLRYALRVSIALGAGYIVGLHLPWAAHPHWILLTIAVVMRTNTGGSFLNCRCPC